MRTEGLVLSRRLRHQKRAKGRAPLDRVLEPERDRAAGASESLGVEIERESPTRIGLEVIRAVARRQHSSVVGSLDFELAQAQGTPVFVDGSPGESQARTLQVNLHARPVAVRRRGRHVDRLRAPPRSTELDPDALGKPERREDDAPRVELDVAVIFDVVDVRGAVGLVGEREERDAFVQRVTLGIQQRELDVGREPELELDRRALAERGVDSGWIAAPLVAHRQERARSADPRSEW